MFSKTTFGTTTANTGFGGFNTTATSSPFGQSAFVKPATTAFGGSPAFGAQQTPTSLFGATSAPTQSQNLFGGATTSAGFGATTTPQAGFGFSQPQQSTSLFGSTQQTAATPSLFGQPTTSAFGSAVKPGGLGGFGQQTVQPSNSLFGQTAASTNTGFNSFGQSTNAGTNVFGGTNQGFGQQANVAGNSNLGTSIVKYQPTIGQDTLVKGGQANNVNTKQHCITAMKEYDSKSLEELRLEDYLVNRKGPQVGTSGASGFFSSATQQAAPSGGIFGTNAQPTTSLFGQTAVGTTDNKNLFGGSAFGQPSNSAFGATQQANSFLAKPFGSPANTGFGATTTDGSSNVFGAKPAFGQTGTPSLFGQTSTANTALPAFGQQNAGFGGFGTATNNQQAPSLFGNTAQDANKPTFGLGTQPTVTSNFGGFGTTTTSTASGGLFGTKPATGFGAPTAFGAAPTANTGFSNFSLNNASGGGLFNSTLNKPATAGFGGFGTQTSTAPLNFNAGTGNTSLFGNTTAKPGGLFGNNLGTGGTTAGGGLFGGGGGIGGFGANNTLGSFGTGTLGSVNPNLGGFGNTTLQQVPIHQQILSKVTSPYGDNPIFKGLNRNDETDATRATNPVAQKTILEKTSNSFKVSSKPIAGTVKIKPIGNSMSRKSLFDGLDDFESSGESFTLKPNVKRLILKPNVNSTSAEIDRNGNPVSHSTPNRQLNISNSTNIESPLVTESTEASAFKTNVSGNGITSKDNDDTRRESWLHPRPLNLNTNLDNSLPLNSTLNELVPRRPPIETYRSGSAITGRPSVSNVTESTFEDQTNLNSSRRDTFGSEKTSESTLPFGTAEHSLLVEKDVDEIEDHPTGIISHRVGYYTIPSLEDLKSYLAEDGSCIVPNFTVGRTGYGNVFFPKEIDVAGLNLDEIVHFRNKEVILYPDEDNKPPVGQGLNREAQVTLDKVWPRDKTLHEPIKDAARLAEMDWEGRLRRSCDKNDSRFVEYRPETGSWVFRVKHFSKYGLSDSDEENELPTDPKKAKMAQIPATKNNLLIQSQPAIQNSVVGAKEMTLASLKNAQKISEDCARTLDAKTLTVSNNNNNNSFFSIDENYDVMPMDKTQYFQRSGPGYVYSLFEQPQASELVSPSAALAKNSGTDAHKLQLMKAAFFMNMDEDNKSVTNESPAAGAIATRHDLNRNINLDVGLKQHEFYQSSHSLKQQDGELSESSSQMDIGLAGGSSLPGGSSSASVMSILRALPTETPSPAYESESLVLSGTFQHNRLPPFVVKPKVAHSKKFVDIVPFQQSIAFQFRNTWLADLGLYNSRFFKVGFGPKGTVFIPVTKTNEQTSNVVIKDEDMNKVAKEIFKERTSNDFSNIILQNIQILSINHYKNFKETIIEHLNIEYKNCIKNSVADSDCPYIQSDNGQELIVKHLDEAIKLMNCGAIEEFAVSVWSLCLALWGEHQELESHELDTHYTTMCRRNLFSEWLENTISNNDLRKIDLMSDQNYLDNILDLILCHKVSDACVLAFEKGDGYLSMLLSQLSSGPRVRQLIEDQLAAWYMSEADKFMELERIKLFMMVAGVSLMNSAHGLINTLEGHSWLKVLAIHLWYLMAPTASITDSLIAYDKAFKSEDFFALPPIPFYIDNNKSNSKSKRTVYDLRYHLLQLYSKRSYPIESLLNPATHTSDMMDYRLSWLLLQTLDALGYKHCSEFSENQLHTNFAAQLENNDLWEWAIFVLLHIKDRNKREMSVQNILYRYVDISETYSLGSKEKFVIEDLGIPRKWVDYAKAVKAGALKCYKIQTIYLLRAQQWTLAHEVIFQYIAPDAIINGKTEYLYDLLKEFAKADINTSNICVPNWSNQGQLFIDYIELCENFNQLKELKEESEMETRWELLKPQLAELCSRINLLPCPTAKHRLLQSEIAQNLANLVRGVIIVCPNINACLVTKIALERLPVPQEFAKQELRFLLNIAAKDIENEEVHMRNFEEIVLIDEA